VNIRIIAATNRDLAESIAERQFRSDLSYCLHVFPIRIPPLRERRQDIPLLVRHFVQKLARKMGKQIDTIPSETLNKMMEWNWPGNIRELENLVQRSVILPADRSKSLSEYPPGKSGCFTHGRKKWETFYGEEALAWQKRFLDHFLRDLDNGMDRVPKVRLEVRKAYYQQEVRSEESWPPASVQPALLYLCAGASDADWLGRA